MFVILQGIPILFYDMVGEKKENITKELMERRNAASEGVEGGDDNG